MTYNYTQPSVNVCNPFVNPALTACGNTHLGNQFVGPQFDTFEEQNNYYPPAAPEQRGHQYRAGRRSKSASTPTRSSCRTSGRSSGSR
jgi:hypothetical protein